MQHVSALRSHMQSRRQPRPPAALVSPLCLDLTLAREIWRRAGCAFFTPVPALWFLHVPLLRGITAPPHTSERFPKQTFKAGWGPLKNYTKETVQIVKIALQTRTDTMAAQAAFRTGRSVTFLSPFSMERKKALGLGVKKLAIPTYSEI